MPVRTSSRKISRVVQAKLKGRKEKSFAIKTLQYEKNTFGINLNIDAFVLVKYGKCKEPD
jgi:hypothetical protein